MKKLDFIFLVFVLTNACSDQNKLSDESIQLSNSSPKINKIINVLSLQDSISFPRNWELLEEFIETPSLNNSRYYGCLKFSHQDILQFIKINELKVDNRTYGVFQPFDMPLTKEKISTDRSLHELRKQTFDIFADTVDDKVYVAKSPIIKDL